eukprot:m.168612 g.168612  ORF g.168612 m.168612 type:complete len:192 (+) comp16652_c0_seq9:2086-2661(+)
MASNTGTPETSDAEQRKQAKLTETLASLRKVAETQQNIAAIVDDDNETITNMESDIRRVEGAERVADRGLTRLESWWPQLLNPFAWFGYENGTETEPSKPKDQKDSSNVPVRHHHHGSASHEPGFAADGTQETVEDATLHEIERVAREVKQSAQETGHTLDTQNGRLSDLNDRVDGAGAKAKKLAQRADRA